MTRHQIDERLASGGLIAVHRGIFRVGHTAPSTDASYLAAVRACGEEAFLGGRAATWLYGLTRGEPPPAEVIAPTQRRVPGVLCRRSRRTEWPTRTWRGIPTLTVPAALVDVREDWVSTNWHEACHEAGVRYRTTPGQVGQVMARRPSGGRGQAASDHERGGEGEPLRLESRFLASPRDREAAAGRTGRRGPSGGLPLARAPADRGAGRVSVPQLPLQLGAGSPA